MTTPVHVVAPDATVAHARNLMVRHRISRLPVMDAGTLAGIITKKDIAYRLRQGEPAWRRRPPDRIPVGALMTENPAALHALYHDMLFDDRYFVLKDFGSYSMAQRRVNDDYQDRDKWLRMAVINTAKSGIFSSDRTIREYNEKIWHLK